MTQYIGTRFTSCAPKSNGIGLTRMLAIWKQRNDLRHLSDRALADIGVTRQQAQAEARRPLWDVPTNGCV